MTIIWIIFALAILLSCRIVTTNNCGDYLDRNSMNSIKGIFIILVFCNHFSSYEPTFTDNAFNAVGDKVIPLIGQLMVAYFLFASGYGVFEQAKRGASYVKKMPRKRILSTYVQFAIAVVIFTAMTCILKVYPFDIKRFLLSLIAWDAYGNSNWYIFCIIIMYAITFIALKIFGRNIKSLAMIVLLTGCYVVCMYLFKPIHWYDTSLCFALGCAWSLYREQIDAIVKKHPVLIWGAVLLVFIGSYTWCYFYLPLSSILVMVRSLSFTVAIVLLSKVITLRNPVFLWAGASLFPLYIYQRLPMIAFKQIDAVFNIPLLYFAICIIITAAIAFFYNWILKLINKLSQKNKFVCKGN